jgi:REP element-mobilizing transposase RayT
MPRKPRLSIPGALHHIMAHGIEGRSIFCDNEDRQQFLALLSQEIARSGFKCYAWVLMDNHYHLLLRVNENPLSSMMRPLNSNYARWFRKKYHGRGYLFQDRFKSLVTQDQGYIEELVRYIHLNPVRSGICKSIAELDVFAWSGHAVIVGRQRNDFQNINDILHRFGHASKDAIREYRIFIGAGMDDTNNQEFVKYIRKNNADSKDRHEHRCWVIGDPKFVKSALEHDRAWRLQLALHCKNGWTVERVVGEVARQLKINTEDIFKRGKDNERSIFRKTVAALAHRSCGIPIIQIARYYGVGSSSISRMLEDGEEYARKRNITIKQ